MITKNTRVVVQGMTGKEGQRSTKQMIESGTNIVCGVTPGKGGQEVEGLPVFDSVAEAMIHDSKINTSVVIVPPLMVYDAAMEAMHNGISFIVIVTENVPVQDSARLVAYAREHRHMLLGPSSIGVLDTRRGKLGSIGSAGEASMYTQGNIAIISKSGGMCGETANVLKLAGMGQSLVIGVGGDVIAGTTFADLLPVLEADENTKAVVVFGEIGGTYEEELALALKDFSKPVVAFVSGQFAEQLGRSLALGHAGAIIEGRKGKAVHKKQALRDAGVIVADFHYQIPELIKKVLE